MSGTFPDVLFRDHDAGLIVDGIEQNPHSIGAFYLSFKDAAQLAEETVLYCDAISSLEFFFNLDKTVFTSLLHNEFDDLVFDRDRAITETDNALHTSSETDLREQSAGIEPRKDVTGEKRFPFV